MEKNPYSMAKLSLEAKDSMNPKRDCGFYAKYVFLFLSLIQFLIILGLVLFMVYGNPQEVTKKRMEGLTDQAEQCRKRSSDLSTEIGTLKRQLNSSRGETAKSHLEASRINSTLRQCTSEKMRLVEQQKTQLLNQKTLQECLFNLQILNMTCPVQVRNLQDQLKMQDRVMQENKETHAQQSQAMQERLQLAEKEKQDCRIEKLQAQSRGETYRLLESQVLGAMGPVRQSLRSTVEQAFSAAPLRSCYDLSVIQQVCLGISGTLQGQVETLARQVDQKVNEVAQKTADLERDKASCGLSLQEREHHLTSEQQRCEREKQVLRDAQDSETKKMYAERQKLVGEKEALRMQLEQSKEACLRVKINTAPPVNTALRFPGPSGGINPFAVGSSLNTGGLVNPIGAAAGPHTYSNPGSWGRPPSQPGSSSQGSLSTAERNRVQELLKENAKKQNQTLAVKPGARSSG